MHLICVVVPGIYFKVVSGEGGDIEKHSGQNKLSMLINRPTSKSIKLAIYGFSKYENNSGPIHRPHPINPIQIHFVSVLVPIDHRSYEHAHKPANW